MANHLELVPFIRKWEGGYSNKKNDKGGCTMQGVTIKTFKSYFGEDKTCSDLKQITDEQWAYVFKDGYWNPCKGDDINDQSIANIIVDWAWMSGVKTAVKVVQKLVGVKADGIIGKQTLSAINSSNAPKLFESIYNEREKFYYDIVERDPSQKKFLTGWLNRLHDFQYV
jgi:lysozyme family protein